MHWLVEIEGAPLDLRELVTQLSAPECAVVEEQGQFFLRSLRFDALTLSTDVRMAAEGMLARINAAAAVRHSLFDLVTTAGTVVRVRDDGQRERFTPVGIDGVAAWRVRAHQEQASYLQRLVELQERDRRVARAVRLFRNATWTNLDKVREIVEEDIAGKVWEQGWATKTEVDRFTGTANNARLLGDDARHGHEKWVPPKMPMNYDEATAMIRYVLQEWLRSKGV